MATKIFEISRAVPGTERKRTRLKAPAVATPVSTFPLIIIMTTQTTAGSRARVTARLRLLREPAGHGAQKQSKYQGDAYAEEKVPRHNGRSQCRVKQSAKYGVKYIFSLLCSVSRMFW